MVDVFADLIIDHVKTFNDVPDIIKSQVEAELRSRGFDTNGDPIPVNETTE